MARFDVATNKPCAKIVYYGPGLCGRRRICSPSTTACRNTSRARWSRWPPKTDRTLIFDFLPLELSQIHGMTTCIQLYTVPGQVSYNETAQARPQGRRRRRVRRGFAGRDDGVRTSHPFRNLEENLKSRACGSPTFRTFCSSTSATCRDLAPIERLNAVLNARTDSLYESIATTGVGVQDTLKGIVKLVLTTIAEKYDWKTASV